MKKYKAYLIDLDGTMIWETDEIDGSKQIHRLFKCKRHSSFIRN